MQNYKQPRHPKGSKEGGRFKADSSGRNAPEPCDWRSQNNTISDEIGPTKEEIESFAREVASTYALFRGNQPEHINQNVWSLLPALETQENEATGQIDISIPPGLGGSATNVLEEIEAGLSPAMRRRFRKKFNELESTLSYSEMSRGGYTPDESDTEKSRRWWALFAATLRPSTALTIYSEDGTATHSFLFIAKEWNGQVETLLSSTGHNGGFLSGEICFPETAYTLHSDSGTGVVYREAEVEEEFSDDEDWVD